MHATTWGLTHAVACINVQAAHYDLPLFNHLMYISIYGYHVYSRDNIYSQC